MENMNITAQRLCVWAGPLMIAVWALSFIFLCRFIPPPHPSNSRERTVELFSQHTGLIKLGLVISVFACALLVPFCAAIAAQMRRMEGVRSVFAQSQLVSGGLLCVEFLLPFAIWQTALYRLHEWNPETVQMLNDMAWLMFLGIISSACCQVASIGVAILLDKSAKPVFPRWAGYYNIWVSMMWVPAGIIPFFKDGPMAWNGVFAWWIPLLVYFSWFTVMVVLLLRAIADDERQQNRAREHALAMPVREAVA
ncbi:hypothetical protein H7I53_15630 [Mycolicibacterium pulveris]|uniref:DUF4386 domain-containing protein n=1 Tax=Mycolicibacterium pulveris TaxID=36813 RepID=A0A7I7UHQ1_MYCPV|nr:hypothetical protein [Mycolicibacterium pulveris]MCV6981645.1 hypothetical protein [Mycolicibacterium pulveris]BBY80199.1 hypothetical protein MPUL_13570 [Mycolicibacterium pulveris]